MINPCRRSKDFQIPASKSDRGIICRRISMWCWPMVAAAWWKFKLWPCSGRSGRMKSRRTRMGFSSSKQTQGGVEKMAPIKRTPRRRWKSQRSNPINCASNGILARHSTSMSRSSFAAFPNTRPFLTPMFSDKCTSPNGAAVSNGLIPNSVTTTCMPGLESRWARPPMKCFLTGCAGITCRSMQRPRRWVCPGEWWLTTARDGNLSPSMCGLPAWVGNLRGVNEAGAGRTSTKRGKAV